MARGNIGRIGRFITFLLIAGGAGAPPAYAQATRIDLGAGGVPGNDPSLHPVVSFDGRYVAFVSGATNLVPGDTNRMFDFFRYDRQTGQMIRGVPPFARPIDAIAFPSALSLDGRWLLFTDERPGWAADDSNGTSDVFQYDFTTSHVRRVSVGPGGVQANGSSYADSMSVDGRYVAFSSDATNLGPPELANGSVFDVFVYDTQTQQIVQVSRGVGNVPANGASKNAMISPDGEWIAFSSEATNLTTTPDTNEAADVYLTRWRTGEIFRVAPRGIIPNGVSTIGLPTWDAAMVEYASSSQNIVAGAFGTLDLFVWERASGVVSYATPAFAPLGTVDGLGISLHGRYVTRLQTGPPSQRLLVHHDRLTGRSTLIAAQPDSWQMSLDGRFVVYGDRVGAVYLADLQTAADGLLPTADADNDGLPNGWEEQMGLDPLSAALENGPTGDPDHDGLTNLQELAANTHPRGFYARYFAEGVTNAFFATRFAILNPGTTPAKVWLRFLPDGATGVTQAVDVPARTRRTVSAEGISGLGGRSFSTVIESDVPVVIDRTVTWDASAYGAHSETSIASPSETWYLAEGSTSDAFALFYLLQNPQTTSVNVTIRYVRPLGLPPITKFYTLPPASRTTIPVDTEDPALASNDVSAVITASQPIIVERAMYWSRPGEPFAAGHNSAGVTAPSTHWFLAEGATGPFFDLFILLLNPNDQSVQADVRYLTSTGDVYVRPYRLDPNSRTTIWVDEESIPDRGRVLTNAAVATEVTSPLPIVVERSMWWPDGAWTEAHNSPGATETGPRWAIADGEVGGPRDARTFILLANPSQAAGDVLVTLLFDDGMSQSKVFTVAAVTRVNVDVFAEFATADGRPFGAVIEALGANPIELVVERATYWNANGVIWAAGTNALGTRLP